MRTLRRVMGLLIIGGFAARNSAADSVHGHLFSTRAQRIEDWGMTVAPLDEGGQPELPPPARFKWLVEQLRVSCLRVSVGRGRFLSTSGNILDQSELHRVFGDEVNLLRAVRCRYLLAIVNAPRSLKTFSSDDGEVQFEANRLRPEYEQTYGGYVADLARDFTTEIGRAPAALTIISLPDGGGSIAMDPAQWVRVMEYSARRLKSLGLAGVDLIGPDVGEPKRLPEYLAQLGANSIHADLGGLALRLPGTLADSQDGSWLRFPETSLLLRFPTPEIWSIGLDLSAAPSGREALVDSFLALRRALVNYRVTHWLFDFAYTPEPGPNSFSNEEDQTSDLLLGAFSDLWQQAPPGSYLHLLDISGSAGASGLALETDRHFVAICINSAPTAVTVKLDFSISDWDLHIFPQDGGRPSNDRKNTLPLPSRSVAILVSPVGWQPAMRGRDLGASGEAKLVVERVHLK